MPSGVEFGVNGFWMPTGDACTAKRPLRTVYYQNKTKSVFVHR
jgi:hypothetical protein